MKKMKKILAAILVAAMCLSLLAACTGGNPETENTNPPPNTESQDVSVGSGNGEGTTGSDANASTVNTVVRDSVNVGVQSDPADFAPWAANSNGRTNALWGIYQELGHLVDGEFYPAIVKEYTLSDDGTYMDCTMFDYITDSAGNHMTANDVVFSFAKGTELGYITGVSMIENVEAISDYVVRFNFNTELRVGDLDTIFRTDIVTQAAYEADPNGMSANPVGTGPYVLTSYVANNSFTYTAREDFWQTDPQYQYTRDMANVKEINYLILPESSQRTMALEQGQIDMCSEISNEDIDEFKAGGSQSSNYWVYGVPDNLSCLIFCNNDSNHVTSDVNLRRAIFYAINCETILESVWKGNGTCPKSIAPGWSTGYVSAIDSQENYYDYSPEKAKEYLAESSYNGEELVILTEATGNVASAAQLVQAFLSAVGINSKLSTVDSTILQATYTDPSSFDILLTQYACNIYTVTAFSVFDNTRFTTGTINHIYDDHLQKLVETAYTLSTSNDETILTLHDYIIENAYGMNMVNYTTSYVAPSFMDNICLSYKKTFIPGGCTYNS